MPDIIIYLLLAGTILYSLICYINLLKNTKKGKKVSNNLNLSGCEVSQKILEKEDVERVYVVETKNPLEERYDFNRKVIRLSNKTFNDTTITDICMAAFYSMHAIEDKKNNGLLKFRNILIPTINIIVYIGYIGIIISAFLRDYKYLKISIGILFFIIIFNVVFLKQDKVLCKSMYKALKDLNVVDEKNEEITTNIVESLTYYFVAYPFVSVELLVRFVKTKIK